MKQMNFSFKIYVILNFIFLLIKCQNSYYNEDKLNQYEIFMKYKCYMLDEHFNCTNDTRSATIIFDINCEECMNYFHGYWCPPYNGINSMCTKIINQKTPYEWQKSIICKEHTRPILNRDECLFIENYEENSVCPIFDIINLFEKCRIHSNNNITIIEKCKELLFKTTKENCILDCNNNGILDIIEIIFDITIDENNNSIIDICEQESCFTDRNCNYNGFCFNNECKCFNGFNGKNCQSLNIKCLRDKDCNNNFYCQKNYSNYTDEGNCICKPGFKGKRCDKFTCDKFSLFNTEEQICQCISSRNGNNCENCIKENNDYRFICCPLNNDLSNFLRISIFKNETSNYLNGDNLFDKPCYSPESSNININTKKIFQLNCECILLDNNPHPIFKNKNQLTINNIHQQFSKNTDASNLLRMLENTGKIKNRKGNFYIINNQNNEITNDGTNATGLILFTILVVIISELILFAFIFIIISYIQIIPRAFRHLKRVITIKK